MPIFQFQKKSKSVFHDATLHFDSISGVKSHFWATFFVDQSGIAKN